MPVIKYRDHNLQLAELETIYLETRSPETLVRMYEILEVMARNIVRSYFRNRGIDISGSLLDDRAHDIAALFIEQYLTREDFHIERSFSGYMRSAPFVKVMYSDQQEDQALSYEAIIESVAAEKYQGEIATMRFSRKKKRAQKRAADGKGADSIQEQPEFFQGKESEAHEQ